MSPKRPVRASRPPAPRAARGFVLVVVLVLLLTLTVLVSVQVRRATDGQAITTNSADYVLAETAAQSVLRYCEAAVMQSAGMPNSVRTTTPGDRGVDQPAWQRADKWAASSVAFDPGAIAFPGVQTYTCLFEDATADLVPSLLGNDINPESQPAVAVCNVQPGMSPRLCKYRITARVTLERGRRIHLQSELRFAI
jgi:Tfp pilus assembly protein PilX